MQQACFRSKFLKFMTRLFSVGLRAKLFSVVDTELAVVDQALRAADQDAVTSRRLHDSVDGMEVTVGQALADYGLRWHNSFPLLVVSALTMTIVVLNLAEHNTKSKSMRQGAQGQKVHDLESSFTTSLGTTLSYAK